MPYAVRKFYIVPVMGLVWLIALTFSSGIGKAYHVYELAMLACVGLFLLQLGHFRYLPSRVLYYGLVLLAGNVITYLLYGNHILEYLWVYLLIAQMSRLPVEDRQMKWVSLMYGGLGMAVLYLYRYGSVFSGWNTNSIGMVAFFSYTVFVVSVQNVRRKKVFFWLLVYSAVYLVWLNDLNARSSMLASVVLLLSMLRVIPLRGYLKSHRGLTILLLLPLVIAVVVVLARNMDLIPLLDRWSINTFGKTFFNGRDGSWALGFETWLKHPLLGTGNLYVSNWHNSAIGMLTGCGVVGFFLWIRGTRWILGQGIPFVEDDVVYGLMLGFVMIWLQQSVEQGLIAVQVNLIPYAMLGLLLGRRRTLEELEDEADA